MEIVYKTDILGNLTFASPLTLRIMGYSHSEILQKNLRDILRTDHKTRLEKLFRKQMLEKIPTTLLEIPIITKNGQELWFEQKTHLIIEEGQITGLQAFAKDVTERKRTEKHIHESVERFRTMADHTPIMLWMSDTNGLYIFFNQPWLDFTGRTTKQELGHGWTENVHQEDRQKCLEMHISAFLSRQDLKMEYRLKRKDGEYRWIMDTAIPRYTPNGHFSGYIGSCIDITERKQLEEELLKNTSKLQAIFKAFPDLYFRLDSNGTILDYNTNNHSDIYLPPEAFLGKRMQDILPVETGKKFDQSIPQVLKTNSLVSIEYTLPLKQGKQIFEARLLPLLDHQIIVIVRNITARKKVEESLQYRSEIENLVTTISTNFINLSPENVGKGIQNALQIMGEFAKVDRCYLYFFTKDGTRIEETQEWCAPGVVSHMTRFRTLDIDRFPWLAKKIKQVETIHIPRLRDLPPEAKFEKEEFQSLGIKSFINVPMVYGGFLIGYIGFDTVKEYKSWSEELIALAKIVGEIFVTALKRKRAEEALRQSEARLRLLVEQIPAILWMSDMNLQYTSIQGSGLAVLNLKPNQIVGQTLFEYFKTDDPNFPAISAHRRALIGEKVTYELNWANHVFHAHVEPLRDEQGKINGVIGMAWDITDRKRFEEKLMDLAHHDPLTNLINRRRFEEILEHELTQGRRHGRCGALLWLDLDRFKEINDSYGHRIGDRLLVNLTNLLKGRLRETDILARMGGDEFAVLLPQTDSAQAQAVAKEILERIRHFSMVVEGQPLGVTASIGITLFPDHGTNLEALLNHADLAMYEAKENGRNCSRIYRVDKDFAGQMASSANWAKRIREALDQNKFVLFAQPILNLKNNKYSQYELLLRMKGKEGKFIPPGAFLDVAERFGLNQDINRWVVRQAIQFMTEYHHAGRTINLSINLSNKAFADDELRQFIEQELSASPIKPQQLIIEIAERSIIADLHAAQKFMEALKKYGCRFALDDFGVGFSSFHYLKHLPVDYLKIDGSFIRSLHRDSVDQHLVKAMVQIAKGLGKKTTAEFVENEETLNLLKKYNVDFAQGFHIKRPSPAHIVLEELSHTEKHTPILAQSTN